MKALFMDILTLKEIKGVFLLSVTGELVYHYAATGETGALTGFDWPNLVNKLGTAENLDVLFSTLRVYIKKEHPYLLVVVMGLNAPVALCRMNCDIALAKLKSQGKETKKGLGRFFKG